MNSELSIVKVLYMFCAKLHDQTKQII